MATLPLELLPSRNVGDSVLGSLHVSLRACDWRALASQESIARWDSLAQWACEPNPFHESWYLLPALRAFDPGGTAKLLCLEANGFLAGLLPVVHSASYYDHPVPHLANWRHANAFLGAPLVAKGFEHAFWRELLAWCDAQPGGPLFLHLAQLPYAGPLHEALGDVLADDRRQDAVVRREVRAALESDLAPEAYFEESLSGKKRKELRRQHRRLAEEGELTVHRTEGCEELDLWAEEFLALEQAGWKGEAGSALACDARTARLFREALAGAAERGRIERLCIRLDGRPLAMLATFISPPGAFAFKTAFDETYARFSPGVLLQRENLAILSHRDIAWTDSCAAQDHPMIDHFWRERRTVVRRNIAIGGKARRLLFRALAARETRSTSKGNP